ncbi:hypothetical protein SISNIDRAFT_354537 [Sistotremastrum niveocremeum HHB9708]|uniref:Uncharacterized protein n=1 Tax=Sistotremastrum niveocremeum HHB9708 TaxID=1314777 RepID=A0A164MES6_9AGAM|nr:hypothetical protein SISNIDRAFT_64133 [Sistotremastrum niveocremeum HHB9708]KZS86640.1 hypothetical protein SISNIDRAFT_354537 [Sistotremastrum niveocremeum HHB9708]
MMALPILRAHVCGKCFENFISQIFPMRHGNAQLVPSFVLSSRPTLLLVSCRFMMILSRHHHPKAVHAFSFLSR